MIPFEGMKRTVKVTVLTEHEIILALTKDGLNLYDVCRDDGKQLQ